MNITKSLACAALLTGCGTPTSAPKSESHQPSSAASASTRSYPISSSAGVETLVAKALEHHPGVTAAAAKVTRLLARVPQAKALPDPKARVSFGSMAETAAGRVDAMVGVEQALPFPGKLREMAKAAGKEAEAAAAQLEEVRLDVAEQVRSAYWNHYLAMRTTAITTENRDALNLVRDSVDASVAADKAGQDDQLRLATEFGKIEKALVESRQAEASAKASLNALLNRPRGAALPRPRASGAGSRGELAGLMAKAEREHPSVRAAEAQLAAFRHRLKRAHLDRYPDFAVGIQHASISDSGLAPSANGRDQVFATLGITIPLWQKPRRAKIEEARAGIGESEAMIGAARSKLRFRVEDAWLRAKSAEELIALFDKQILPEAKQAFDAVLAGYTAETRTFVDLLDTWRSLLGFQLQQAGNRAAYGKAIAALRSAVGGK